MNILNTTPIVAFSVTFTAASWLNVPMGHDNNNCHEYYIPIARYIYVPDSSIRSYESVKLHVSDLFDGIDLPEDEEILIIIRMLEFFITQRRICEGMVPMFLDIEIVTTLHDNKAARDWMMRYSMLYDEIKTMPAAEWSIQALEKLRVSNGGGCCMVCLEEWLLGSQVSGMPCKHVLHHDCIAHWLRTMHVCPICRFCKAV